MDESNAGVEVVYRGLFSTLSVLYIKPYILFHITRWYYNKNNVYFFFI